MWTQLHRSAPLRYTNRIQRALESSAFRLHSRTAIHCQNSTQTWAAAQHMGWDFKSVPSLHVTQQNNDMLTRAPRLTACEYQKKTLQKPSIAWQQPLSEFATREQNTCECNNKAVSHFNISPCSTATKLNLDSMRHAKDSYWALGEQKCLAELDCWYWGLQWRSPNFEVPNWCEQMCHSEMPVDNLQVNCAPSHTKKPPSSLMTNPCNTHTPTKASAANLHTRHVYPPKKSTCNFSSQLSQIATYWLDPQTCSW